MMQQASRPYASPCAISIVPFIIFVVVHFVTTGRNSPSYVKRELTTKDYKLILLPLSHLYHDIKDQNGTKKM